MRNQRKSGTVKSSKAKWFKIITAGVVIADGIGIYAANQMLNKPVMVEDAAMEEALVAAAKPDYQFRPVVSQQADQAAQTAAQPQTPRVQPQVQLAVAKPVAAVPQAQPAAIAPVAKAPATRAPIAVAAAPAPRAILARSETVRPQVARIELPRPAFGPSAVKPAKAPEARQIKSTPTVLAVAKTSAPAPVMVKKAVKPVGVTLARTKAKSRNAFASVFAHGITGNTSSRITEPTGSYGGLATRADAGGQVTSMQFQNSAEAPTSAPENTITTAPTPDDAQSTAQANSADSAKKALGTEPSVEKAAPETELPAI